MSQESLFAADSSPAAGCAALAAEYDWSNSDFGPQDDWDPAVAAVVRTLLEATAPMAYCHGARLSMVYNDHFADQLGARHPRAWGQPVSMVMPEMWSRPGYAAAVNNVLAGGRSFHDEGNLLDVEGQDDNRPSWAYLARSYSPVRASDGSVLGILVVVVEIAPVLVLVSGPDQSDQGAARWRGVELWDQTVARQPLIWSGFRASARAPEATVPKPEQRFVAEGIGDLVLPMNGPDIGGSIGYLRARRHLPDVQMLTLAGRDEGDTTGAATRGEFYDVFAMPDGRVALTIGDVRGAGTAASEVMAKVKVSIRGAALTSSDPNVILAAIDELVSELDANPPAAPEVRRKGAGSSDEGSSGEGVIVEGVPGEGSSDDRSSDDGVSGDAISGDGFGGELFVTGLLGVFDPATGDLVLASAGHPAPAVVHRWATSGQFEEEPGAEYATVEPGPPLGIAGTRPVAHIALAPGDALVGFTEGLLQRRGQSLIEGQSMLLETLSSMSATAARSISQHVVDTLIGDQGLEHDCALLVVIRDSNVHQMASALVPPHTIAVRGVRRWTGAQLESWGLGQDVVTDAVLCISELVSNVVQHAGTSARVSMELAERLLVTVEDTGTWSAPRTGPEDLSGVNGRGLALVAAISDAMGHARGAQGSTVWFEIILSHRTT
jgi:anti-sigma regulatory factor (Ser/Thr protein kinase)